MDIALIAGNLALDFINTVGDRLDGPHDYLQTSADVSCWSRLVGLTRKHQRLRLNDRQLASLRAEREWLYALFRKPQRDATDVRALGVRATQTSLKRELTKADGTVAWRWKAPLDDIDCVLGPVYESAVALLSSGAEQRVRQCEGDRCGWLFLDLSRAGHRRWCSMADCGNRAKARSFRERSVTIQ